MTLTLIRHGLTEGNLKRLYYGSTDLPLTEAGIAALHSDPPAAPEAQDYYTSGMRRTEQTFAILFGERPHEIVRDLREIDFGHFEMRSYEELKDDPEFRHWCDECRGRGLPRRRERQSGHRPGGACAAAHCGAWARCSLRDPRRHHLRAARPLVWRHTI